MSFDDALDEITTMIQTGGGINESLLGDLEIQDVLAGLQGIVSGELGNLSGLSDDAAANEEVLRQTVQNATMKAFFTGLLLGSPQSDPNTLYVTVSSEAMREIGVKALQEGNVNIALVTED